MATSGASGVGTHPLPPELAGLDLSLVRGDIGFRLQRRLGLIPAEGMGTARRALIFATVTWLPLAIWALLTGRLADSDGHDTFLAHFGIHARCLIAIPLLVIAEGVAQKSVPPLLHYFVESGLVAADRIPPFRALVASMVRLRDSVSPWIFILSIVVAWSTAGAVFSRLEDLSWKNADDAANGLTFGGWWFIVVIRPLFTALLLAWLWRACLVFILILKLAHFPLSLVPTHPDRLAGLGFVERLSFIFSPVAFALSTVAAASFAHDVVYHGVNAMDIKALLIATAVLVSFIFLVPFAPLTLLLVKVKRQAILDYGGIAGQHGRLVRARWILGKDIGAPAILDAPELGPVADVQALFDAVRRMRTFPVGKLGVLAIAGPAVLPMLYVVAIQFPLTSLVGKVIKTLI
ncbi:hypothetical protein PQR14_09675 [Paraburkholderia bryophila]|uniref:hypothetical protein n=2 Tax=Paraburkholderia TaxID=1822464 RepID=UPI0038BD0CED